MNECLRCHAKDQNCQCCKACNWKVCVCEEPRPAYERGHSIRSCDSRTGCGRVLLFCQCTGVREIQPQDMSDTEAFWRGVRLGRLPSLEEQLKAGKTPRNSTPQEMPLVSWKAPPAYMIEKCGLCQGNRWSCGCVNPCGNCQGYLCHCLQDQKKALADAQATRDLDRINAAMVSIAKARGIPKELVEKDLKNARQL